MPKKEPVSTLHLVAANESQMAFVDDLDDLMEKYRPMFPDPILMLCAVSVALGRIIPFVESAEGTDLTKTIEANITAGIHRTLSTVNEKKRPFRG